MLDAGSIDFAAGLILEIAVAADVVGVVKRNNISYNMSLPVWRAIFLPCSKKPYSAGFAAMQ